MIGWRCRCLWCARRFAFFLPRGAPMPDDCLECPFCGLRSEVKW